MIGTERQEMLTGEYWEYLIKKSVSRYFLLDMLSKRPMHGYEVAKSIETCCEGWSKPTDGMIYPTIKELTSGGFLECVDEVHGGRARKVCHLTPKGKEALEAGARAWAGVLPYLAQSVADAGVDVQLGVTGTLSANPCCHSSIDRRADEKSASARGEASSPGSQAH